jgi:hypothetical protein
MSEVKIKVKGEGQKAKVKADSIKGALSKLQSLKKKLSINKKK